MQRPWMSTGKWIARIEHGIIPRNFTSHIGPFHSKFLVLSKAHRATKGVKFVPKRMSQNELLTDGICCFSLNAGVFQSAKFSANAYELYSTKDRILEQLCDSSDFEEIFIVILENEKNLNYKHVAQAVWALHSVGKSWILTDDTGVVSNDTEYVNSRREIGQKVSSHPDFLFLMNLLQRHLQSIETSEVVKIFFSLCWLTVQVPEQLMTEILLKLLDTLPELSTKDLALFSTAVRYDKHISEYGKLNLLSRILNVAAKRLDLCDSIDDLQDLAVVFYRCSYLLQDEVFSKFGERVKSFLSNGELRKSEPSHLLKMLQFLNVDKGTVLNDIGCDIMECLELKIDSLHPHELVWLNTMFVRLYEPASLIDKVTEHSYRLLETAKFKSPMTQLHLLACIRHTPPESRPKIEDLVLKALNSPEVLRQLSDVFHIAKIRSSRPDLMKLLWQRVIEFSLSYGNEYDQFRTLSVGCTWYFEHILFGSKFRRSREFESVARKAFSERSLYATANLSHVLPFLVATSDDEIPNYVMEFIDRTFFTRKEIMRLRNAVDLCMALHDSDVPSQLAVQLSHINRIVETDILTSLESTVSLVDLVTVIESVGRRPDASLMEMCIRKCESATGQLSSKLVCDFGRLFCFSNWLPEDFLNSCVDYFLDRSSRMSASTASQMLIMTYNLGFTPKRSTEFTDTAADKILNNPDGGRLRGLTTLQAALGLDFLQALPIKMVHRVFSIPFLDKLDAEIKSDMSKYPFKVRYCLMLLNRAVCLGSPEAKIPWFHETFCQSLFHNKLTPASDEEYPSAMNRDIYLCLLRLVGGTNCIRRPAYSSYYHRIDFELCFSQQGQPLPVSSQPQARPWKLPANHERVAILTPGYNWHTLNTRTLRGRYQTEVRELELLGYRVIVIPPFLWNSMELSDSRSKNDYLSNLLWPDRI